GPDVVGPRRRTTAGRHSPALGRPVGTARERGLTRLIGTSPAHKEVLMSEPPAWGRVPLIDALLNRRSRRFARGMRLDAAPLAFASPQSPAPLSLEDEALLAFAACGVTGYALAELPYQGAPDGSGGGNIMSQFVGRTAASGDAMHVCAVFVVNDRGAWL